MAVLLKNQVVVGHQLFRPPCGPVRTREFFADQSVKMLEYLHASKNVGFEYDDLEITSDGTIKKGLGWNTLMLASLNQRYVK